VYQIIRALGANKKIRLWPQNTGTAFRNKRIIKYGLIGSADISGIIFPGFRLEIEVKTGNAVQSPQQKNFQKMIEDLGGIYILAHSVSEANDKLQEISRIRGL
jgi:hypothetical protein